MRSYHPSINILKTQIMQVTTRITTPAAAERVLHDQMKALDHEEVWAVFLDRKASVIGQEMLSKGTLTETAIDCRTVLRNALLVNAASVILFHNHQSGDPRPSVHDIQFTQRLKKACSLVDVILLDHIVVCEDSFFSFADESITNI